HGRLLVPGLPVAIDIQAKNPCVAGDAHIGKDLIKGISGAIEKCDVTRICRDEDSASDCKDELIRQMRTKNMSFIGRDNIGLVVYVRVRLAKVWNQAIGVVRVTAVLGPS